MNFVNNFYFFPQASPVPTNLGKPALVVKSSPNLEIGHGLGNLLNGHAGPCNEYGCSSYAETSVISDMFSSPLKLLLNCIKFKYKVWKHLKELVASLLFRSSHYT